MGATEQSPNSVSRHSFRNPPVVETALTIQFEELRGFRTVHFGLYHELIREDFPVSKDRDRVAPIEEVFPPRPPIPGFRISTDPLPNRVWFLDSEAGNMLIQVQPDRFSLNWRDPDGLGESTEYPRYSANSRRFLDEFTRFSSFCKDSGIGSLVPTYCEVVYVNHIYPAEHESIASLFGMVFPGAESGKTAGLPEPENITFNRTYEIGEEKGRLYAEAGTSLFSPQGPRIVLKLTGRVRHESGDLLEHTVNMAHDSVFSAFLEITSDSIRKDRWGQTT